MGWIRHLPSVIASGLLFGFIGTPLGLIVFVAGQTIASGHPKPIGDLDLVIFFTTLLGAVPAFVTGLIAGILRVHVRSLPVVALLMAPIGALVTAIYLYAFMLTIESGVPFIDKITLIGAIAAFCCTFLLWRNRAWQV